MGIVIQIAQLVLSLSILIILHEMGHFLPAKWFKTRVEKFFLFFDPGFSLFQVKIGETLYGIGWLPLGGYVKISGMVDESMDKEQMKEEPKDWEFRSKPAWQRLIILIGGVTVNLVLGILIYIAILFTWGQDSLPVRNATMGAYCDEVALETGFQHGDMLTAVDTVVLTDHTFGDVSKMLLLDQPRYVMVERNAQPTKIVLPVMFRDTLLERRVKVLFQAALPYVIDSLVPKDPGSKAGLQKGDQIVAVAGTATPYAYDVSPEIKKHPSEEISIDVVRNNQTISLKVKTSEDGTIGIGARGTGAFFDVVHTEYTFAESIPAGIGFGLNKLSEYVEQFEVVFSKTGAKHIGGFGTIGSLFPTTWNWHQFWQLTAFLSIILAFMNILPIPALDGGHVMFVLYEMITRRKPNEKFMEYAQIVGFVLLVSLLLWANGNDIYRAIFG